MYEFDLKTFVRIVVKSKKRIIINCCIAVGVAVVIAFSIPKEYSASVSLASELQGEENMAGGLGSLASMAGINLNSGSGAIVPVLYPDVVHSNNFLVRLLDVRVKSLKGDIDADYFSYLKNHTRNPWWVQMFGWVGKVKNAIFPPEDVMGSLAVSENGKINPFCMSPEDAGVLERMRFLISCQVDDESQVITLCVHAQDPLVAATMVDSVRVHLQDFITEYHTSKARVDLDYYRKLEMDTKKKYLRAQKEYANFCDAHKGTILQAYISEQESLENELQLAYTAYSQMKQQVQMAEAKVQERTPAFTEIEGASVPIMADSPKKLFILLAFVFLSFVGTIAWLYVRLLFFRHE